MVDAHVSGACVERHAGSSPVLGTVRMNNCGNSSVGRHNLAKVRVASSSLVFRSKQEGQCRDTLAFFIPCRESGIKNSQ